MMTRQTMLRFYLRLAFLPLTCFAIALLLIRFQPYDDHELRQLLLPDNCSTSCFMGIRPGVTTTDEALQILKDSGWVDQMTVGNIVVTWGWNGRQPQWIDASQPSQMTLLVNSAGHEVVSEIGIPTRISTGSIMLAMQNPLSYMLTANGQADGTKAHFVSLRYNDLIIKGQLACPSRIHQLVDQPAIITFYNHINANFDFEDQFWNNEHLVSFATDQIICN